MKTDDLDFILQAAKNGGVTEYESARDELDALEITITEARLLAGRILDIHEGLEVVTDEVDEAITNDLYTLADRKRPMRADDLETGLLGTMRKA